MLTKCCDVRIEELVGEFLMNNKSKNGVLVLSIFSVLVVSQCTPVDPLPDALFEIRNTGYCPDNETRTRLRDDIQAQINGLKDNDLRELLRFAQIEDNITQNIGACPPEGCTCPDNTFRLGIWRNDIVKQLDRVASLNSVPAIVPEGNAFAVRIRGSFIRDIVMFKWNSIPKRYNGSTRKASDNGNIELLGYEIDYPESNQLRLKVNGVFREYNDPSFELVAVDTLSTNPDVAVNSEAINRAQCQTNRSASADTSLLDGLSWFLIPFAFERNANGNSLEDLFGITGALNEAKNFLPTGAGCASASVLPSYIPIPTSAFGRAVRIDYDYNAVSISPDGLTAFGNIVLAQREPQVKIGYPTKDRDGNIGWSEATGPTGPWLPLLVGAPEYGARIAKYKLQARASDMREPISYSWLISPITWPSSEIVLTGAIQDFTIPIGTSARPGDIGYAFVWITAVDADGLRATSNAGAEIKITTCCDVQMFKSYFNQFCADEVGVNRERCR